MILPLILPYVYAYINIIMVYSNKYVLKAGLLTNTILFCLTNNGGGSVILL